MGATVAGFFADRWGTDAVFQALAGFALLTLGLAVAIWRLAERPPEPARPPEPGGWPARPAVSRRQE